jgi:hypothetical protein
MNKPSPARDKLKNEIASAAVPLGCHPPMDKDRDRVSRKSERESTTHPPRRRSTTPGAGRDRPGSSTAPPGNKAKKKNVGAALDPTHHQRGCHPERRSNPAAPRQGIKTASASRKIGRESSTLRRPRRRAQHPASIGDTPYLPPHSSPHPRKLHLFTKKESAPAPADVVWRGAGRSE